MYIRNSSAAKAQLRRLRAGADLHIASRSSRDRWGEKLDQLALQTLHFGPEAFDVGPGELRELGILIVQHLSRLRELTLHLFQARVELPDRIEPGVLAAQLLELGRIACSFRVGQLLCNLLRPRERLAESGLHGSASDLVCPVFLAEPFHPPGGIHQLLLAGIVGVALGADFDVNRRHRRLGDKGVSAGTLHGSAVIGRVDAGFHCSFLTFSFRKMIKAINIPGAGSARQGANHAAN